MSAHADRWEVVDTPMRPRRYKVVEIGKHSPDGASSNNATSEYFADYGEALHECYHRNKVWPIITKVLVDCFANDRGVYSDKLLRWLAVRRDYPFDNTPEPECPEHLTSVREETLREFRREHISQRVGNS